MQQLLQRLWKTETAIMATLRALDKEATIVAATMENRDSYNGNIPKITGFGENQVYKTASTNVLRRNGSTKSNMDVYRAGYFTSSMNRYGDGRRCGLMQTCEAVTMDCDRWYRDVKSNGNGVSAMFRGCSGSVHSFVYSYCAESCQNRGNGYFTDKLKTHIAGGCNGRVQNRDINGCCSNISSCPSGVQDSSAWTGADSLRWSWEDSRNKNVEKSQGDSCSAILHARREDGCNIIVHNNREDSRTTRIQNNREDNRTTCVQNNEGDSRTNCVHNRKANRRATGVQNNSTDSSTDSTEINTTRGYVCTIIERCASNVQHSGNTVIKHLSARQCTIREQGNNEESCKNCAPVLKHGRSNNLHNSSTDNCTSVRETRPAGSCASNLTNNFSRDCMRSENNDNAENNTINQHQRGATNATTVMHAEKIDIPQSCKQNHDGKSKLEDKDPFQCEHTRKLSLNCQATICNLSTQTGVANGTKNASSRRRDSQTSGIYTYTTRKGGITSPRFWCPQEKSFPDPLTVNESCKLQDTKHKQQMYANCVNYAESPVAPPYFWCPREQASSASLAKYENSHLKVMHIIHPRQAACVGSTDPALDQTTDIETPSLSRNSPTHVLFGSHERALPACRPQVCSQSKDTEKRHHCQYYNMLANRHIGNLIQPVSNIAIAETPRSNRRTKLNRDIWPTETKNRTWSNGVRDGNGQWEVSKFPTAHERSHSSTNKEMISKHSRTPSSHTPSATSSATQQQKSTDSEKPYLFKRKGTLDKSSKSTISDIHNFRKLPRIRQQRPSAAPQGTRRQTSSCPVIQINSQPEDKVPQGFVLDLDDSVTPTTGDTDFPTFASRSPGFLSVPGPLAYFEFERFPNLSKQ